MNAPLKGQLFIDYAELKGTLKSILISNGFSDEKAEQCSWLFSESTLDGIYSHGVNRFPLFIDYVERKFVNPDAEPFLVDSRFSFEKWDGKGGPGNLNALFCMDRAISLAHKHGNGIVAIRNTNHWMRGGSYGIQAAKQNCIGICITNTKPNMPPWGGREVKIGNNPLIISVPYEPYPILLDMAMSQFAYGKFEILSQQGKNLPMDGGYDSDLNLTDQPDKILESELALPMGYWKGSGLAIMIDLLVSLLSEGLTTSDIGNLEEEHSLSQLFLAIDIDKLSNRKIRDEIIQSILQPIKECEAMEPGKKAYYPGEQTWMRRTENIKNGIPVNPETWKKIMALRS